MLLVGAVGCANDSTETLPVTAGSEPVVSTIETTSTTSATFATSSTSTLPVVASSVASEATEGDRADDYLAGATEIYRRTLPGGEDFVVRLSSESYASVFGLTWRAPTGSAELCLGDHALFLGVPGRIGSWGSAWVAAPWFDRELSEPVALQASMAAADEAIPSAEHLLVRTDGDASEVVLTTADGTELDRTSVVDGLAMVVVESDVQAEGPITDALQVMITMADGRLVGPTTLAPPWREAPVECGPGEPPQRPLPDPDQPPANPDGASELIRERLALLVDPSVPLEERLEVLDDDAGVRDAVERLESNQYADLASSATYEIDELVFTQPDQAWFRYTITTPTDTFSDRFGIAAFNGTVWQITRATICQDLAFAAAPCEPSPAMIDPPPTEEWQTAWQEWVERANLYNVGDGCPPLGQC